MVGVVDPVWNLHYIYPILSIGVPISMPPKVMFSGRVLMVPTKSIVYGDIDRLFHSRLRLSLNFSLNLNLSCK